jgi:hypothetical protein
MNERKPKKALNGKGFGVKLEVKGGKDKADHLLNILGKVRGIHFIKSSTEDGRTKVTFGTRELPKEKAVSSFNLEFRAGD